jgi:Mitochondrial ribosomal protein L37
LGPFKVGDSFSNINYFKGGTDPVLKPDSDYPLWIWEALDPIVPSEYIPNDKIKTKKELRTMNKFKIKLSNGEASIKKL